MIGLYPPRRPPLVFQKKMGKIERAGDDGKPPSGTKRPLRRREMIGLVYFTGTAEPKGAKHCFKYLIPRHLLFFARIQAKRQVACVQTSPISFASRGKGNRRRLHAG